MGFSTTRSVEGCNEVVVSWFGQIESRNNRLEMQAQNNSALVEELNKLLERLRVPSEVNRRLQ